MLAVAHPSRAQDTACPDIKFPCSCSDTLLILENAINNDPYRIEAIDIDRLSLNETCKAAIQEKMVIGGIDIAEIFETAGAAGRYTPGEFLNFARSSGLERSKRKFPMEASDLGKPGSAVKPAVCIPEGTDSSKAVKENSGIKIVSIPKPVDIDGIVRVNMNQLKNADCLIYLPYPYIADGALKGHNELHPHNSSYIISALVRTGDRANLEMAKNLLGNFFFEIENFGYPICGNSGIFLTRSENNTIPTNVREYFETTNDYNWLENEGLTNAVKILEYWNTRIGVINLNSKDGEENIEGHRWFASGIGPAEEAWKLNRDYQPYYFEALYRLIQIALTTDPMRPVIDKDFDYNRALDVISSEEVQLWRDKKALKPVAVRFDDSETAKILTGHTFILSRNLSPTKTDEPAIDLNNVFYTFKPKYFSNDRAARASGYTPSHLYGPWGAFTDEFVDAVHNIQLYRGNKDVAEMYSALAEHYKNIDKKKRDEYKEASDLYKFKADTQKDVIFKYLWNEKLGMIFNYSNHTHTQRTSYPYAGAGYAIWAGLFDVEKDEDVKKLGQMTEYMEKHLEGPAGIYASGVDTGLGWDKPFVWPVSQGMIVQGLRSYISALEKGGRKLEAAKLTVTADRIAVKYLCTNFKAWVESKNVNPEANDKIKKEEIITGFETGLNYPWNLAAVWDLYDGLTPRGKAIFDIYGNFVGRALNR